MKAMMILGSRNPDGQTAKAASALTNGMASEGVQTERINLPTLDIARCRQCNDDGWGTCRSEGRCSIQDDFSTIVEKIGAADIVAFATPVYYSDLSESMRAFLDRLRRTCTHDTGRISIAEKPALGICVAGGGGGGGPACTVSLEKMLNTAGFDVIDMIPIRRQNLEMKLEVLQITGKWVVTREE
jgi:multimeric flavodoxin WrbA